MLCYYYYMTKIAIIEDDPVIRQMYLMKFEAAGFDVSVAENGKDGVEMVERTRPDIILLDISMPVMDGNEALAKIRQTERGRDIPVLILTNLGEEEAPKSLHKLGITSYIVKADFTPRQVVERVRKTLNLPE